MSEEDNKTPEPEILPAVTRNPLGRFVKGTVSGNPRGAQLHKRTLRHVLLEADKDPNSGESLYVKTIIGGMKDPNPAIRQMAAKEFSNRAYGPPAAMDIPPSVMENEQLKEFVVQLIRSNPELMKMALEMKKEDEEK